jgi:LysR family cyn operon transcriptional activator
MDLKHLEAFVALTEELHFTRTAERLGIAQPTLSLQIRALEERVGLPLFDRTAKRLVLTQAGIVLLKHARHVVQALQSAEEELSDLKQLNVGELRIAMLSGDLDFRLTPMLINFRKAFPKIRLILHGPVDVRQMILQNTADIGLTVISREDDRVVQVPYIHEYFGIVTSAEHPLSTRVEIPFVELPDLPIITFPREYPGRRLIDAYCVEQGVKMKPLIETSTVPSIVQLIRSDLGVSILPFQLFESFGMEDLRFIPIVEPTPVRDIGIIYRADRYLSHAARSFLRMLTSKSSL